MFFKRKNNKYISRRWNGISVFYTEDLNGGGTIFADDYIDLFQKIGHQIKPGRIYEWCSGPAFVGYALLAHGFGTSFCGADIYPPAVEALKYTAKANNIEDRVSIYLGDGVGALPKHEKFDLVIGNPPQFHNRIMLEYLCPREPMTNPCIYVDPEWIVAQRFFSSYPRTSE